MTSNKCPKCGLVTLATATVCKNCSYKFTANDSDKNTQDAKTNLSEKPKSWADTFCALNLFFGSIVLGIVFCLYWDFYVLSHILPSGTYPVILLILFYLPAAILAIVCGFIWFAILRFIFKAVGFKLAN